MGIETPGVEHGSSVGLGGGADVAALNVAQEDGVGSGLADVGQGCFKAMQAVQAHGLVEGQIGLVGAYEVGGGVDDGASERGYVGNRHEARVGVEADADEAA